MLEWAGLLPKVCKVGEGGGGQTGLDGETV